MITTKTGAAFPMGATVINTKAVQFVIRINRKKAAGLVLYEKKTGKREEIEFTDAHKVGNVYSCIVEGIDPAKYSYNFLENGLEIRDPYAKRILGGERWGEKTIRELSAGIEASSFDWDGDCCPMLPYTDSVIYQLHVRGFTKHPSSGVKKKGTFEGIVEKIPYLTELGITAVELLPSYEFSECEATPKTPTMDYVKENYMAAPEEEEAEPKLNYWGFKEGAYFAPKAAYSAAGNPVLSFKTMVKELHKAGIEVIMQFYFPETVPGAFSIEVIKYWVQEYHIDGAHLLGVGVPVSLMAAQPELINTKLLYEHISDGEIYDYNYTPSYINLAAYNDGYLYAVRKFLKGDVGSLNAAFHAMTAYTHRTANIVYLTNYNTFTLMDMVSYDRKHNEDNGEGGKDGNNNNFSWNCGMEGPTRKKNITALREQQLRNAMTLLLLSKGTPVLTAGDEFGNSQKGNNNPYCQDNVISWLNWKDLSKNQAHFEYTKKLLHLIKAQSVLQKQAEKGTQRTGVEYPYMSFHGKDAWKLDWNAGNEEAGGILYYADRTYIYIGVNMHWQDTKLALPNLPFKGSWEILFDTAEESGEVRSDEENKSVRMPARSIKIMMVQGSKSDFNEGLSAF